MDRINFNWQFLSGKSRLRDLLRKTNWADTSLGNPQNWPVSLLSTVSLIMENPMPMCIFWGNDFIQLYNDGFANLLGEPEHNNVFSKSAEVTYHTKWAGIQAIFHRVLNGEPVFIPDSILTISQGHLSEKNYDFTYSPIKDLDGNTVGILCTAVEITEKKLIEGKLEDSKNQLFFAIESAGLGTWDYNPISKTFSGNEKLKSWFNLATDEELDLDVALNAIDPEDKIRVINSIERSLLIESGGVYDIEYAITNSDTGQKRIVHAKGKSWFTEDNVCYRLNGTLEDVTEQVLARNKIEEREQSIRSIIDNSPFPIGVFEGEDLIITLANQTIKDVWGKGNDIIGKSYRSVLPELKDTEVFSQIMGVFSTGVPFHAKNMHVFLEINGVLKPFYYNYSFTPLYNTSGEVYAVMNTAADVTDIHLAKQQVEESEKRFRNSVEQAPLGITILRGDNYIVEMANENYLSLVDKTSEEFIGKPIFDTLPEVKDVIENIFRDIKLTGMPFFGNEFPVTLNRYRKQEVSYFNFVYHPLKEENGEISGIMAVATEVTDTVKAKHLLLESENHFRNLIMQSPIPMTILRGDQYIIESANKAMFESVWRREPSELIGVSILDAFPELKDQKYPELLRKVYATGVTHSEKESPALVRGADGIRKFFLDFEYAPLLDAEGFTSGMMITVNDVTDKVEARVKVEKNEERLNIVVNASELGVWEYDIKNETSIISSRCNEIFGFLSYEIITTSQLTERFHPDDLEKIKEAYEQSYKSGTLLFECRIVKNNSLRNWIEVRGKVFLDDQGQPDRMVGTIRDITDAKGFHKLLLEREEKFRLLADSMPQMIWTSDSEGNLNYYNQALYDFTGFKYEDISGEGWLQIVHPDERKDNIEKWKQAISTGKDFHFEHRFKKTDGSYRWQLSRAIPQRDEQGNIRMWVGSSTDIQDQKLFTVELEKQVEDRTKELNLKNNDLEKMNKELQSFAYISSHDLQEPLRKIQTFSSMLMEDEYPNMTERGREMFGRMLSAAQRMQTLIQDLLAYSRTTSQDRQFEIMSFNSIINDLKDDLKEELLQKDAELILESEDKLRVIPFQFKQLLMNLISNALKFSDPSRSPRIMIDSKLVSSKDSSVPKLEKNIMYHHISVSDNGIGFDSIYSEKIFEVFQRLHGKADYIGTGIGLAIVKKIVDNHEGFIKASGELDKGATFDIYIPA
ncbi:PAS domain S-box-containing protein [Algoriphagus ratkowskyi]|uniref:histidine kinase n=1 Tax=Algoriphagus ratkowskyi TaxID=57028 RepID=A0A2W7RKE1_9BACT|nr:PAS domain-containing protein [Algoriphagus ratkowskyi]PZX61288.1 PAS domain S-box-containing protein [Algoriphagus ratkowskyi]TXD79400.1 PAS domain S-box protein [Algoriphagus ratkowskyi]